LLKRLKEKEEGITQILNTLAEESAKGTLILVEGKKDIEALHTLGIEGPMLTAKTGGRSFVDVCQLENQAQGLSCCWILTGEGKRERKDSN
jgi:5S rRNA maturation endonuclease (ribonuclease M5)